jgi:hypothetical protein
MRETTSARRASTRSSSSSAASSSARSGASEGGAGRAFGMDAFSRAKGTASRQNPLAEGGHAHARHRRKPAFSRLSCGSDASLALPHGGHVDRRRRVRPRRHRAVRALAALARDRAPPARRDRGDRPARLRGQTRARSIAPLPRRRGASARSAYRRPTIRRARAVTPRGAPVSRRFFADRRRPFRTALLATAAALVALSRVVLGVHFPLDVTAGALLGATVGLVAAKVSARKRSREAPHADKTSGTMPP